MKLQATLFEIKIKKKKTLQSIIRMKEIGFKILFLFECAAIQFFTVEFPFENIPGFYVIIIFFSSFDMEEYDENTAKVIQNPSEHNLIKP